MAWQVKLESDLTCSNSKFREILLIHNLNLSLELDPL